MAAPLSYVTQVRLTERQRRFLLVATEATDMRISEYLRALIDDQIDRELEREKRDGGELHLLLDRFGTDTSVVSDVERPDDLGVPASGETSRSRS